jgi:hypothetical protein
MMILTESNGMVRVALLACALPSLLAPYADEFVLASAAASLSIVSAAEHDHSFSGDPPRSRRRKKSISAQAPNPRAESC